eukprot:781842-Rhodomonas_salina.2
MDTLLHRALFILPTVTLELSEAELGQLPEGPLIQALHDHWTSERRRQREVPVEAECSLCPHNLMSRQPTTMRKRKYRQTELESPSSSSSSDADVLPENWTLRVQWGTRRVAPVHCTVDKRSVQPTIFHLSSGNLVIARDRVFFQQDKVTLWSTEKAKFCQWLARYHLSEAVAATLGLAQHEHALASLTRGVQMPAWPYLMTIMDHHSLNIVVCPSVFEAPPYTAWSSLSDNFEWGRADQQLILLGGPYVVLGRRKTLDEGSLAWLGQLWSEVVNNKDCSFAYKSHWWLTGNKATELCDTITAWTKDQYLNLPLSDHSFDPPIPLTHPENGDFLVYFENTPSGPYSTCPGQHAWTDGSMVTRDEAQLVGAGVVGYLPEFIRFNFSVGGPATSQRGEMAASARTLDLAYPNDPLTIYTDCMSILNAVALWRLGDFQPRLEDEKHQDVLLDLLRYLRRRGAQTHFVWITSHICDAGN